MKMYHGTGSSFFCSNLLLTHNFLLKDLFRKITCLKKISRLFSVGNIDGRDLHSGSFGAHGAKTHKNTQKRHHIDALLGYLPFVFLEICGDNI